MPGREHRHASLIVRPNDYLVLVPFAQGKNREHGERSQSLDRINQLLLLLLLLLLLTVDTLIQVKNDNPQT